MSETIGKIVEKDGKRYYCEDGQPVHRGVVKIDSELYYAGKEGELVSDSYHVVHSSMTNDLVKRGTYRFDESGKLDKDSYIAPLKRKKHHRHHHRSKKSRRRILLIVAAASLAVVLCVTLIAVEMTHSSRQTVSTDASSVEKDAVFISPLPQPVYLCNNYIKNVYEGTTTFDNHAEAVTDAYRPLTVDYHLSNDKEAYFVLDGQQYPLESGHHSLRIDNLYTGKSYEYQVVCGDEVQQGTLTTAPTNRFVKIGDLQGVRDIGGYYTASGKRIKQGLIIRGTEIDGLVEPTYYLSDPADAAAFGFVYDFDLRNETVFFGAYTSPLGEGVGHRFYDSPMYASVFSENYRKNLREIFSDLAKPENYPMYMHCTYGVDRTGTIVFLLQALLGVEEDQLFYEYGLSGSACTPDKLSALLDYLDKQPGATLSEKTESFLKNNIGITDEQIRSLYTILLES